MAPQGSKPHDVCKCPIHAPDEWLVSDLIAQIRERDDVLDELVMAARNYLIYLDDVNRRARLIHALVAIDEVERIPL